MSKLRTLSICASDIPKELLQKSKNGKLYLNLTTYDNDSPDKYGNDFAVWVSQSKEEREAKVNKIYLGNGKIQGKQNNEELKSPVSGNTLPIFADKEDSADIDDLPF